MFGWQGEKRFSIKEKPLGPHNLALTRLPQAIRKQTNEIAFSFGREDTAVR